MKIVKYFKADDGGLIFDPRQAVKDGWNVDLKVMSDLNGIKLIDRKDDSLRAKISHIDYAVGIARVHWVGGGWNCLDHAVEQFKRDDEGGEK